MESTEKNIPKEIPATALVITSQAADMLTLAQGFTIATNEEYTSAAEQLKAVKAKFKQLEEARKSITSPMDEAKKRVMDFFRNPLQALTDAEGIIKRSMIAFDNEQERLRKAEEARLQEIARKEQERLDKAAEKKAATAEAKGDTAKAEGIRQSVPVIQAPVLADNKPKVAGISMKTTWSGKVVDKMALIQAVAEGKAPATLLDVNTVALNQMARTLKGEMNYPGVEAVSAQQIAA